MPATQGRSAGDVADRSNADARTEAALKRAKIPERFADVDLDDLGDVPERYRRIVGLLRTLPKTPRMIALVGTHGAGKTHMACGVIRETCAAGRSAMYCRALDFFVHLKSSFSAAAKLNQQEVEEFYRKPYLLVVDEVDVRADTPWEDMVFTGLLDGRYADNRATILISNKSLDELSDRLGPRLADRIRQDGGGMTCNWPSFRGKQT